MLSNVQKRRLRAHGHELKPYVIVGKEGLGQNVVTSLDVSLTAHELVKVSLLKSCPLSIQEVAKELTRETGSQLVHIVGHTCLLYRASKKNKLGYLL